MNKKIITLILVMGIILAAGLVFWPSGKAGSSEFTQQKTRQRFQTLKIQYKQAEAGIPVTISPASTTAVLSNYAKSLTDVKVGIVYERINDARPKRTIEEQIKIFKEINPDMIFRASWRWHPLLNSCSEAQPEQKAICADSGYSFDQMKNMIAEIKKQNPNIIIVGALPAQKINENEVNEITGETFDGAQTAQMALDPAKWGINSQTKDAVQRGLQKKYVSNGRYPDITNPQYQELFLSWAKRQIDSGMDAIWIDLLFTQAGTLARITKDVNHPAVKESYEAASKIVDKIHKYGESKGKHIYVGTWSYGGFSKYPSATPPKLDFVTESPAQKEIYFKKFDDQSWEVRKANIKKRLGNIPIFIFIDWADDNGQLAVFSQKLTKEQQREALKAADDFFESKGMRFIYPVHGGSTGHSAAILSYGKYAWYDSLAPESQTYDAIKELAQRKAGK